MSENKQQKTGSVSASNLERLARQSCADCGGEIGLDNGPPDGWQLDDGRTVCHACCVAEFGIFVNKVIKIGRTKTIIN